MKDDVLNFRFVLDGPSGIASFFQGSSDVTGSWFEPLPLRTEEAFSRARNFLADTRQDMSDSVEACLADGKFQP